MTPKPGDGGFGDLIDKCVTQAELRFFVSGSPVSQGSKNPFAIRRKVAGQWVYTGRVVMVESGNRKRADGSKDALNQWRDTVKLAALNARNTAGWRILDEPVTVNYMFWLPAPQKPQFQLPATSFDQDKLARAVNDALTGVLWVNDSRICDSRVRKRYAVVDHPTGVEVCLVKEPELM